MILSDVAIKSLINEGQIKIYPLTEEIGCASIDLHLGKEIFIYSTEVDYIDITKKPKGETVSIEPFNDSFLIPPYKFVLAHTEEIVSLGPRVAAMVTGVSSVGRLGLFVENAGFIDPGFSGQITLELYNAQDKPIRVKKGMRICQLVFFKLTGTPSKVYAGKYVGQIGVTPSRMHEEFKDKN